jgi:hypothetical protein
MLNIICLRDTLINQKTLKLTNSSNNKESILRTVIGARTTEPADKLAILVGGITKSNLSPIPLNPCHLSLSFFGNNANRIIRDIIISSTRTLTLGLPEPRISTD